MVAGARPVSLAVAAREVRVALEGVSRTDKIAVLVGVLAEEAQRSGQAPLFLALVQEAVRERLGGLR